MLTELLPTKTSPEPVTRYKLKYMVVAEDELEFEKAPPTLILPAAKDDVHELVKAVVLALIEENADCPVLFLATTLTV